jgi:hypothetical protein
LFLSWLNCCRTKQFFSLPVSLQILFNKFCAENLLRNHIYWLNIDYAFNHIRFFQSHWKPRKIDVNDPQHLGIFDMFVIFLRIPTEIFYAFIHFHVILWSDFFGTFEGFWFFIFMSEIGRNFQTWMNFSSQLLGTSHFSTASETIIFHIFHRLF